MAKELDPLPKNESKFWEHAEIETSVPKKYKEGCEHYFVHISSREVECKDCHIGYYLGPNDRVKDGHIYMNDEFVF